MKIVEEETLKQIRLIMSVKDQEGIAVDKIQVNRQIEILMSDVEVEMFLDEIQGDKQTHPLHLSTN